MMSKITLTTCLTLVFATGIALTAPSNVAEVDPPAGKVEIKAPTTQKLTIEDFESGTAKLEDCSSLALEGFIQELNRQKDRVIRINNGQGSPQADRLWHWIQKACDELLARGYHFDDKRDLFDGPRKVELR